MNTTSVWDFYKPAFDKSVLHKADVLILGDGFVGRALAVALSGASSLSRLGIRGGTNRVISNYIENHGASRLFCDFSNLEASKYAWSQALRKYDVVINTIANTNTSSNLTGGQVQSMIATNCTLPIMLAELCQSMNIVFVNISTACLLPDVRDVRLSNVKGILQAESPYYATKALTDNALRHKDCVITVRPRLIYDGINTEAKSVRSNLTHRIQSYASVYDCEQSFTHRLTLVAAIAHLADRRLQSTTVSDDEAYNVTDQGLSRLQYLTVNPDVKVIPCDLSIHSSSPVRVIQADITKLLDTGFIPIDVSVGIEQARLSVYKKMDSALQSC